MQERFSKRQRGSEESNSGDNLFRVIIAGSRSFANYEMLKANMNRLLQNISDEISIVCGTARGADRLVVDWECARYTKPDKLLNARDTLDKFYPELKDEVLPVIQELGL